MNAENAARAREYYTYVGEKKIDAVKDYLHPDVELHGPLAVVKGRDAVVNATRHFMEMFESLVIRTYFASETQAMVVYDSDIPGVAKDFPGASLLSFQGDLIAKIQLFYDGSRFVEKKEEIFSS